ncbi:uncharacterized protein LOC115067333 [Nannospalax galili]|uniref:uncharacterized protein LOC115067333 n=1 Tax=Nannospalax galili TaxID=1026970 RepID=UPI00111C2549|nr:uncharacterized protein LOC115067333 [Nannospalax galili]
MKKKTLLNYKRSKERADSWSVLLASATTSGGGRAPTLPMLPTLCAKHESVRLGLVNPQYIIPKVKSYSQAKRHIQIQAGPCCSNRCQWNEGVKPDAAHVMTRNMADNGGKQLSHALDCTSLLGGDRVCLTLRVYLYNTSEPGLGEEPDEESYAIDHSHLFQAERWKNALGIEAYGDQDAEDESNDSPAAARCVLKATPAPPGPAQGSPSDVTKPQGERAVRRVHPSWGGHQAVAVTPQPASPGPWTWSAPEVQWRELRTGCPPTPGHYPAGRRAFGFPTVAARPSSHLGGDCRRRGKPGRRAGSGRSLEDEGGAREARRWGQAPGGGAGARRTRPSGRAQADGRQRPQLGPAARGLAAAGGDVRLPGPQRPLSAARRSRLEWPRSEELASAVSPSAAAGLRRYCPDASPSFSPRSAPRPPLPSPSAPAT